MLCMVLVLVDFSVTFNPSPKVPKRVTPTFDEVSRKPSFWTLEGYEYNCENCFICLQPYERAHKLLLHKHTCRR